MQVDEEAQDVFPLRVDKLSKSGIVSLCCRDFPYVWRTGKLNAGADLHP